MKFSRFVVCPLLVVLAVITSWGRASADRFDEVRRDISRLRYEEAESKLVDLARSVVGDDRQEALYMLAGLKRSVSEAQIIYQEVSSIDQSNRWGILAQLELAKIEFALGDYDKAFAILNRASACRQSQEACYFQGLSAVMLKDYDAAKEALSRIKGGKYRSWAYLSLAEVENDLNDPQAACTRYRSMARSFINPTAMYRYGECLEKQGRADEASRVFAEIMTNFANTPEALLAAEKLNVINAEPPAPAPEPAPQDSTSMAALSSGYTLQFGAFNDRTNAIKLAVKLKRELPGVRIDSDLLDFKEVHRVRFGYYKTRAEALRASQEISKRIDEPCTIMTLP